MGKHHLMVGAAMLGLAAGLIEPRAFATDASPAPSLDGLKVEDARGKRADQLQHAAPSPASMDVNAIANQLDGSVKMSPADIAEARRQVEALQKTMKDHNEALKKMESETP